MACGIDHNDPDALPAFLCRHCNPARADAYIRLQRRAKQLEEEIRRHPTVELQKELQAVQLEELLL
jgi:hypothetical protein